MRRAGLALAGLVLALAACGGHAPPPAPAAPPGPARAPTAGGPLLAALPAGADAVAELDLARLRDNPKVGPVIARLIERARGGAAAMLGFDPLADADVLVAAAYRVGTPEAGLLVLARGVALDAGEAAAAGSGAARVDDRTVAFGPPELLEGAVARAAGQGAGMDADRAFLALRDAAMPLRAPGASLRLAARLGGRARVEVAGRLALDEVPATLSVWLDVVDDLAMVALLGGDDEEDAERLAQGVTAARARLGGPLAPLRETEIERRGATVRLVWVVGPRALERWAERVAREVESGDGAD